jgi:chromate transporter
MQTELQEKRQWVRKDRFVEGVSLANLVPGATATQLAIFLGYARAGWWGGLLGGLCFIGPGFVIMLALTLAYATLGVSPIMRGALYGLGPVVLGIYVVAVYRLGQSSVTATSQLMLAVAAAAAMLGTALGIVAILLLAGGVGLFLFHSRKLGAVALVGVTVALLVLHLVLRSATGVPAPVEGPVTPPGLAPLAVFLFKAGAFTFGGGLTMIAFIEDQVVRQFHWLTPQEFIEGLALGQFTPGPILVVAAYIGYKVAGLLGAAVGATAVFLPSFILMLAALPVFDRIRTLAWTKAAMRGIGPAVIGVLAVSLLQLAPHAVPDLFAFATLVATVAALVIWRIGTLTLMLAGSVLGIARNRLSPHLAYEAFSLIRLT